MWSGGSIPGERGDLFKVSEPRGQVERTERAGKRPMEEEVDVPI